MWGIEEERPLALGHFADSMAPLHGYRFAADLRAGNEFWLGDKKEMREAGIYCGPGLWFDRETARPHHLHPRKMSRRSIMTRRPASSSFAMCSISAPALTNFLRPQADPTGAFLHEEGHLAGDHGGPIWPVIHFYHNTLLRESPVFRDLFLFGLGV